MLTTNETTNEVNRHAEEIGIRFRQHNFYDGVYFVEYLRNSIWNFRTPPIQRFPFLVGEIEKVYRIYLNDYLFYRLGLSYDVGRKFINNIIADQLIADQWQYARKHPKNTIFLQDFANLAFEAGLTKSPKLNPKESVFSKIFGNLFNFFIWFAK
jgi:hypothetical protein